MNKNNVMCICVYCNTVKAFYGIIKKKKHIHIDYINCNYVFILGTFIRRRVVCGRERKNNKKLLKIEIIKIVTVPLKKN